MEHEFGLTVIFIGGFLLATALLQELVKRLRFPYTVALLILGFLTQFTLAQFHLDLHVALPSNFTYFVLLPALLFGAAMHVNFHQFKIQFKTISFVATFGMLLSMFVVAFLLPILIGLPFEVALLFGALISSTDPIAVLALFNSLGAPKRLALLADGESMFNDATGVIAFRVVSAMVIGSSVFNHTTLIAVVGNFAYMFFGSLIAGACIGYLTSKIISYIHNDVLVETTLTLGAALMSFAAVEHFFHLSGVISSVIAGLVVGNLGRAKFSPQVIDFVRSFWDYLGFLAVSFVFFFATLHLDIGLFVHEPLRWMLVVLSVLVARAVSIYVGYGLTNRLRLFADEPNVPLTWQHILQWGGLRGVIPLVLVFTIPESYAYREELFTYALATLLFTLFVNGLTIEWLLKKLQLHILPKAEAILSEEHSLFEIDRARQTLRQLPKHEFSSKHLAALALELEQQELDHKASLFQLATSKEFEHSLRLEMLQLERMEAERLFREGYISENVLFDFDVQLDMQQDALEYPEVFEVSAKGSDGKLQTRISFRQRLRQIHARMSHFPVIKKFLAKSEAELITERFSLLKARLISSEAVVSYLDRVQQLISESDALRTIDRVRNLHQHYVKRNQAEMKEIHAQYAHIVDSYHEALLRQLVVASHAQQGVAH